MIFTAVARLGAVVLLFFLLAGPLAGAEGEGIVRVTVEGLEGKFLENVRAFMEIAKLDGKPAPAESRLRWLHARAEDEIRAALQPFGYYQPTITVSLDNVEREWRARYRVELGPPLKLTIWDAKVLGEGARDSAFQQALAEPPLKEGDILDQTLYEDFKERLQLLATERGYFDARLAASEIRVDLESNTAAVKLYLDTGRRYRFGLVNFTNTHLDPRFLSRYMNFQPGDPYDSNDLLSLQSDLINSEYFDQVEVSAPVGEADDLNIPVDVGLGMRKSRQYTFGLGYGTDTGVRVKGGIEGRWLNRWGHRYDAQVQASQIGYRLGVQYKTPGADPRTDWLAYRALFSAEKTDVKDTETILIGVSKRKQYKEWLTIAGLDYQRETFRFDNQDEQTTGLLIPSINLSRIVADDRTYAKAGSRIGFELRGAYESLLSDISFVQAVARLKWIVSLGERGRLITRADVGTTYTSDFERLPATLRFFTGGDTSVRGYSLDSIGPRDADDKVLGGKNLAVASLEYEHRILDKWSLAAFVDAGDAFDGARPELKKGVGLGVRWLSPVGPVRVDLATALDRPPGDIFRLHLSIGPDF